MRSIVRFLLEHDLADRLNLLVFPVIVGAGRRQRDGDRAGASRAAHDFVAHDNLGSSANRTPRVRRRECNRMGKLIYSLNVSVDCLVETPDDGLDWAVVDDEVHSRFRRETAG
jgi:hypothetical protein